MLTSLDYLVHPITNETTENRLNTMEDYKTIAETLTQGVIENEITAIDKMILQNMQQSKNILIFKYKKNCPIFIM